jgi:hypothetical protein
MLKIAPIVKYATPRKFRQPKNIRIRQLKEKRLVKQSFSLKNSGSLRHTMGWQTLPKENCKKLPLSACPEIQQRVIKSIKPANHRSMGPHSEEAHRSLTLLRDDFISIMSSEAFYRKGLP